MSYFAIIIVHINEKQYFHEEINEAYLHTTGILPCWEIFIVSNTSALVFKLVLHLFQDAYVRSLIHVVNFTLRLCLQKQFMPNLPATHDIGRSDIGTLPIS